MIVTLIIFVMVMSWITFMIFNAHKLQNNNNNCNHNISLTSEELSTLKHCLDEKFDNLDSDCMETLKREERPSSEMFTNMSTISNILKKINYE